MMNTETIEHLQKLIKAYKERLRVLELQAARFGLQCPPHIHTEIDEITDKIEETESLLKCNTISYFEGRETLKQYRYMIDSIENNLRNIEIREEKVYRLFGIVPVWSVSVSVIVSQIIKFLFPAIIIGVIASLLGFVLITGRPTSPIFGMSCSADEKRLRVLLNGKASSSTSIDLYVNGELNDSSISDAAGNYTFTLTLSPNIPPAPEEYSFMMKEHATSKILWNPSCGAAAGGPQTPMPHRVP